MSDAGLSTAVYSAVCSLSKSFALNVKNLRSLFLVALMQGANFLFPAAILPFLIRYLGPSDYGLFNLSQTWAIYFSMVIAYGFDLSATKDIASQEQSKEELDHLYSKVFFCKMLLFLFSTLVFCAVLLLTQTLKANFAVYAVMFLWTLSQVFFPSWFYMGKEKQSAVSLFYMVSRALSFLLILGLVCFHASLLALVTAYSLPQILLAILWHRVTQKKFGIRFSRVSVAEILTYLKNSFSIFLTTIVTTLTVSLSVILLGFYATQEAVGYFAVASKLVSLLYGLVLFPFQIVFFPVIVKKINGSYATGIEYFGHLAIVAFTVMAACCSMVYFFAPWIVHVFVGKNFSSSVTCLKIVCFVPLFAMVDTLFGLLFVALNRRLLYNIALLMGTGVCLFLNLILIPRFNETGASVSWLVAEACCFLCFLVVFIRKDVSSVRFFRNGKLNELISDYGTKVYRKRKVS